ncbi:MAG: signal peptidase II [Methylovirgula sp.]
MQPRAWGALVAIAVFALDQANKLWLIFGYDLGARQPVRLTPFLDLVFAKNSGISYSLLRAHSALGRWSLFALAIVATGLLALWLWHAGTRTTALGLGLIIGGALGNACDRLVYGYVADFYHFHVGSFSWYVFNLADVAICAGVALLLFEPLIRPTRHAS